MENDLTQKEIDRMNLFRLRGQKEILETILTDLQEKINAVNREINRIEEKYMKR